MSKVESLYIHIPYCFSKCKYCDFFSVTCNRAEKVPDSYVNALCCELAFRLREVDGTVGTVYVGGGTPSLLTTLQLSKILDIIRPKILNDTEITIEANPDDITKQLLEDFSELGINRISIGIQSLNDDVLLFAGRRAGRKENINALESINKNWKGSFSVDLISALPQENMESFEDNLKKVLKYNPDHISLYSLTIEEETPLGKMYKKNEFNYDWDFADEMWIKGRDVLIQNGYSQYEISNYCKNGYECKHNLSYWNHKNYIGCGSGAIGTVYPLRWTNTVNINDYIKFWLEKDKLVKITEEEIPQNREVISKETEQFEFFMMELRKLSGFLDKEYKEIFQEEIPSKLQRLFQTWQKKQLAKIVKEKDGIRYSLTQNGILFLNTFLESI